MKEPADFYRELNPQQYEVVTSGDGPSLVIAGAGSGKTRALTYRVAYLLQKGVKPSRIFLATFTNKAAREMLRRVGELTGDGASEVMGGTFHHIAHLILRKNYKRAGLSPDFTIIDREDSTSILKEVIKKMKDKNTEFLSPDFVLSLRSLSVNAMVSPLEIIERRYRDISFCAEEIHSILLEYNKKKRSLNLLDFDDLLEILYQLLNEDEGVRRMYAERFEYVLVDEYQDISKIQAEIVDLLSSFYRNIMVVGDDSQSIYSFRGANPDNMFDFLKKYPEAKIHRLEVNYRSSPSILSVANNILRFATRVHRKELKPVKNGGPIPKKIIVRDEYEQAEYVSTEIKKLLALGLPPEEIAVLFRSHYQSMELEMALLKNKVDFEVRSGLSFFETAHIKDILSFLRILSNPEDEISWKRILKLYSGIGDASAQKIWEILSSKVDKLRSFMEDEEILNLKTGRTSILRLRNLLKKLTGISENITVGDILQEILNDFYDSYLKENFLNYDERKEDIEQMILYAGQFQNISQFLSELSLLSPSSAGELRNSPSKKVVLSTIHQAKGLEWEAVFIIGLNEGRFPAQKSLEEDQLAEEERRLFYVAVTRAKRYLYLLVPVTGFSKRSRDRYFLKVSRFVDEIPLNLIEEERFET